MRRASPEQQWRNGKTDQRIPYSGKQHKTTCDASRRQPVPVKRNTTTRRKKSFETRGTPEHTCNVQELREPVTSDVAVPAACRPPHHQGRPSSGLVTSHGTRETRHNNMCYDVHNASLSWSCSSCAPSHSDDWLPQLSGSVKYLFVETKSPFLLSTFGRRWTCERRGKLHLPHPKPLTSWCVLLTTVTRLASAEQHRPRREADGIGHQNDELLRHEPARVAHRQPEAVPEEPEEQRVDLLQVVSESSLRWSDACLTTVLEVRLDRRRQRGNHIRLHLDGCRVVALAILFVRLQGVGESSGHVILQLQNALDLAALRCTTVEKSEMARPEPKDS